MKQAMQCPTSRTVRQFVDVGLRSSDIVDAAFDEVTWEDGFEAYMWRVMYGLFFFLLVGVILFNIVAGIIIDKFSEMREEQERRSNFFKTTNIISGLTTNQCEEKDISFDDLNDREQNEWQYVFLLAHLKDKRPEEFSGAEEMIFSCFNCNDFSWLPHNTSCVSCRGPARPTTRRRPDHRRAARSGARASSPRCTACSSKCPRCRATSKSCVFSSRTSPRTAERPPRCRR